MIDEQHNQWYFCWGIFVHETPDAILIQVETHSTYTSKDQYCKVLKESRREWFPKNWAFFDTLTNSVHSHYWLLKKKRLL